MEIDARTLTPEQAFIRKVQERHKLAETAREVQDEKSMDDLRFCDPTNQWSEPDRMKREGEGKPCLSIDRTTPFVKQVTNEQRQNRPDIHISATGEDSTEAVAEVLTGMIRHIGEDSNSDQAIDTGFESMVRMGYGFVRVITEYESPTSFNQVLKVKRIPNAFMVKVDPSYVEADGSDIRWATIEEDVPLNEFRELYGSKASAQAPAEAWVDVGNDVPGWATDDGATIRLVEYYELKHVPVRIRQGSDGKGYAEDEKVPKGVKIIKGRDRDSFRKEVRWWKLNALEVLEGGIEGKLTVFEYVPIVPIFGDELIINNERIYAGLIRHAKDVQRMINYWKSTQTYIIAMAPKAPWIGPIGFRGEHEEEWNKAAISGAATLEYEWWSQERGQPMPEPKRDVSEPPIRAITEALGQSEEDIKAVLGMFDPSLGNNKGMADQSGVAIKSLQSQGAIVNLHFADNLARALKLMGRILVKAIPKVYDTKRITRIIEPDGVTKMVTLNDVNIQGGIAKLYDVTTGTYDVVVTIGPSYNTKRQENLALLLGLLHEVPMIGQIAPDIIVSQMDAPITKKLVARIQKGLPPGLVDKDGQPPLPPGVAQHLQQTDQLVQQQHQIITQLQNEISTKKAELESKERIANLNAQVQLAVVQFQTKSANAMAEFKELNAQVEHRLDLLHEAVQIEATANAPTEPGEDSQGSAEGNATGGSTPGQQ